MIGARGAVLPWSLPGSADLGALRARLAWMPGATTRRIEGKYDEEERRRRRASPAATLRGAGLAAAWRRCGSSKTH